MNYLAHIYLSGSNKQIQIGGFIADFVKGNKSEVFPANIWKGVVLHRKIDDFTDKHPAVKEAVSMLRPTFGRYSAIIVDMYFDYFLARNFSSLTEKKSLWFFTNSFSINALIHFKQLPPKVRRFIFHFTSTNRLYKYRTMKGLYDSLQIMATYKIESLNADDCIQFLKNNETELYILFKLLFNDLKNFASEANQTLD